MAYANIIEIKEKVNPEKPCAPEQFPDFNPEDVEAWAYFIYVYLDSSQRTFGRPGFLPKYRVSGQFEYGFLAERNPFAVKLASPYDAAVKASYIRQILGYVELLTRGWLKWDAFTLRLQRRVMGFEIKGNSDEELLKSYTALYKRAMKARDAAWRKIMTYCAALIGKQDSKNSRLILPEMTILYSYVKPKWNDVFGRVAGLVITSGYRTPAQQSGLAVTHSAQTTHALGGAIDVQPELSKIFFSASDIRDNRRFVFWGYLAWLFRVIGFRELGKVPYTLVETDPGNNVVHVSYAYLLYTTMKGDYKQVLPGFLLPYEGDLPHTHSAGRTTPKAEMQGPNTVTAGKYWESFDESTFNFDDLSNDVFKLTGAGAVSASWLSGFVNYLKNHKNLLDPQDQTKVDLINTGALDVQASWSLPR